MIEDSPQRTMWRCVILQALLDATKEEHSGESEEAVENRAEAIRWIKASIGVTAEDFNEVCRLAGLDPEYTRTFALRIILTNDHDFVRRRINTLLHEGEG